MERGTKGEVSTFVAAPADVVYGLVTDVTRMGDWSPETIRCQWIDGATGPTVGARFKGTNKIGIVRWSTKPLVVAAEPGRAFAFETRDTRWSYRFEPVDGGTEVTEAFETTNDTPAAITFFEKYVFRIKDRKANLEAGMRETLQRIKSAAEQPV